uniref:Clp R domain-containing protein n=1 Tax=Thermogemmatispora argillosa TaxID=2045280 RepID=A0A455T5Z4_9CHLR|nr:hypothetical protein KTA_30910 [Thermogemmatispora argillosa]
MSNESPDQSIFPASLKPVPGTFQWWLLGVRGDPAKVIPPLAEPWERELGLGFSREAFFCLRAALEAASQRGQAVLTPFHLLLGFCESKSWDLYLFPAGPSSALIAPAVDSLLQQESPALQLQWQHDPALQEALASAREEAHERGYPIVGIETFLVPDVALQRIFALAKDEARQHGAQYVTPNPMLRALQRITVSSEARDRDFQPCQPSQPLASVGPLLLGLLRVADEGLLLPSLQQLLTRFGLSYAVVRSSLSEETFSL